MMTKTEGVTKAVLTRVRRMVKSGHPVTKRAWKIAYNIERVNAIADTLLWKQKHITIERS